jgi:methylmalonyl-CoA mutase C-terminal domain/subunit
MPEKHRIVIAKPGLDGHDRGAKVVARALRDAGHSGAHMTLFPRVVELLRERGATDVVVFGGGIIPKEDFEPLKEAGIEEIFTPGAPTTVIIDWLKGRLAGSRTAS